MKLIYKLLAVLAVLVIVGGCFSGDDDDVKASSSEVVSTSTASAVEPETSDPVVEDNEESEVVESVSYSVADKEVDSLERVTYWVRLDTRVIMAQNLKNIANELITTDAKSKGYNAFTFFFIGPSDNIGYGYTLGRLAYAPDGEYAGYSKAKSDYSNFEYFNGDVVLYNENNMPTEKEFEIAAVFEKTLGDSEYDFEKAAEIGYSEYDSQREENAKATVASKYGITSEEVEDIYVNVVYSRYSNSQEFI